MRAGLYGFLLALVATAAQAQIGPAPSAPGGTTGQCQYNLASRFAAGSGCTVSGSTWNFVAPVLGAATATSINGIAITSGTGTLTLGSVTLNAGAGGTLGSNAFTSTAYLPLAGGTLTGGLGFSTTNTLDIGTNATTLAPRTVYAGTSFIGPVGNFTTSVTVGAGSALTSTGAGGALGTAAFQNTGTSGANVPLLNGTNTWSGIQSIIMGTGTGPDLEVAITGDTSSRVAIGINTSDVARVSFGPGNAVRDVFLERVAGANLRHGAPDAAAPVAQTVSVQNVVAGTSNTAGAAFTFKGSQGTGTGAGGSVLLQVAPATTTGSTQNAIQTVLTAAGTAVPAVTINSASFGLSGNISSPAWTTSGIRYANVAATLTDTTSSGTVATVYNDLWGGNTNAASSATVYTQAYGSFFKAPIAGTNVTMTNKSALGADSISIGGAAQGANALAVTGNFDVSGFINTDGNVDLRSSSSSSLLWRNVSTIETSIDGTGNIFTRGSFGIGTTGTSADVIITRDAANTLAQRNGVNAQTFNIYNTYTDASNYEVAQIRWTSNRLDISTSGGGTGSSQRNILFQAGGGTSRLQLTGNTPEAQILGNLIFTTDNTYDIGASGATRPRNVFVGTNITSGGAVIAVTYQSTAAADGFKTAAGGFFYWNTRSQISSPADGQILIQNTANTDFSRLQFGGTTSSFPAIGRSTTDFVAELADGTAGGTMIMSGSAMVGSLTKLTLTQGAIGMSKITASASAPGAAGAKFEVVCGTNAGTAKLIMAAGTSGTAVTVVDNVGAGVTGC